MDPEKNGEKKLFIKTNAFIYTYQTSATNETLLAFILFFCTNKIFPIIHWYWDDKDIDHLNANEI